MIISTDSMIDPVWTNWFFSRSNGALEVRIKKPASKPKAKEELLKYIIQKQDGATLYISRWVSVLLKQLSVHDLWWHFGSSFRDIAAFFERRKKYDFSKIIYVVGESAILPSGYWADFWCDGFGFSDMSQRDHFYKFYETVGALDRKQLANM